MFKTNTTSFGQLKQDQWTDRIVCKNYKILSEINKGIESYELGSFGHIFLAVHQLKGDYYAVKIVPTGRNPELALSVRSEAEVLMKLNGSPGFPRLAYFIQDANYSYIVQSLLGKNLYQLFAECDHKFSMKTVLQFLDNAITRLEFLHQNEYIHRDIKPENFMVGLTDNQLYLIDFGFSLKYIEGGKHISRAKTDKMIGTPRFCPNCAHLNVQQNRASDLESLGYLAVYFLKGSLPWMHLHASSKEDKMKVIGQKKLSTTPQELCQGLPAPFEEYFRYINNIQFELAPNYDYCRKLFKKLHHSLALPEDNKFDWIKPDMGSTEDIQQKKAKLFMTVGRKSFTADVSIEDLPQTKRTQQIQLTFKVDVSNLFLMTDLREEEMEEFSTDFNELLKIIMRQQVTFQPIQNQSVKFDTNAGTSRFAEIRDKQMTFQDEMFEIPVDNPKRASGGLMHHCKTHQLPYKLVCTTVGCSHELLCEKCDYVDCNIADLDQFRQTVQSKGVLQEWHSTLLDRIQQLKHQLSNQIEEWSMMAIAKVINDNTSILLNASQTKSLLNQEVQYQKLVYNNFIDIASLNTFFQNPKTTQREDKLFKEIQEVFHSTSKQMQELLQYGPYIQSHALNKHLQSKTYEQISDTKSSSTVVALTQVNSSTLAAAQKNGAIMIMKCPSFQELCRFQHGIECTAIASVQDESGSNFLLSAGKDDIEYQIYLWNLDVRQKVGDVIGHSKQLRKIISLSDNLISWCQEDSIVRIWNLAEKQQVNEVAIHSSWINDICKITDNTIATCSRDYTVAVVDFNTAQPKYIIKDVTYVNAVCKLSSNTFAFANYHGHIKVYSSEAPILIRQMQAFDSWMGNNSIWSLISLSDSIVAAASEKEIAIVYLNESSVFKRLIQKNSEIVALRILVSFGSFSGYNDPPKYGDFEAQRHWMELTLHTDQWYTASDFNDLTWWPLDYPPLSGYYAYVWGQIANYYDPQIIAPYTSRGNESINTILLMRISVIISDLLFLYPILIYLVDRKYLAYVLCNPLLILVDHGHFQYNCILLGLTLTAATLLEKKHQIKASILFVMALNFKVMGLYYSLGFFIYILLNANFKMITVIGVTVIASFAIIWFGFNPIEVLTAIFPVHRGLYQLQVATFWCFSNIFIKWQYLLTNPQLFKLSTVLTVLACIPSLLTIRKKQFTVTLFLLAQAFFIFSFHVHEKTILLPLIMLLVNIQQFGILGHDYSMAALISLHPLMIEDGLFKQYLLFLVVYGFYGFKKFRTTEYKGLLVNVYMKLRYIPYLAYIVLATCQNFIQPPNRYPYIYELDIQMISLSVYSIVFLIAHSSMKPKLE